MKVRCDENGIHLFDRVTGLNILVDEVSVPPGGRHSAPRFVSIALTNACDLSCHFCYAPKTGARLDLESVLSWAVELDDAGCLGLGFGGGEPTLHPDFPKICRRVAEETNLAVSFTTHGHRVTEQLAEELTGVVHFVRISLDGVGATYERIRGRSFEDLLDSLDLVRTVAPFGVNYVVNAETIGDLDAAARLAFDRGAFELLLLPESPVNDRPGIDLATSQALSRWIEHNYHYRLAISAAAATDGLPIADPFSAGNSLDAFAHVDAAGWLRASSFSRVGTPIQPSLGAALCTLRSMMGEAT